MRRLKQREFIERMGERELQWSKSDEGREVPVS